MRQYDFVESKSMNSSNVTKQLEGMTVFNTEQVNTKKQPMFFGKPLGFKDTIHTNIPYLTN